MSKSAATRLAILQKSFELIYTRGYQATSIDDIIATTQVTKGAFFYHFKNKDEMGLAMINQVMYPGMYWALVKPLVNSQNPVTEIYTMMKDLLLTNPFFDAKYGCPAICLLGIAMPLKYYFHHPEATRGMGTVHGALFLLFVFNTLSVGVEQRWKFTTTTWKVLLACIIPFGTFYIDKKILAPAAAAK